MRDLKAELGAAAFAFRGYNVTNLGRSRELLTHPDYGPIVAGFLKTASEVTSQEIDRPVNLADRVMAGQETTLEAYPEAVALIMGMELAQLKCLEQFFDIRLRQCRLVYGYSLGEITALVAAGAIDFEQAMRIPLAMSADCAELAKDVTLGILFSRGPTLDMDLIERMCIDINSTGHGVVAIATHLAPNSVLLLGQGDTIDRFGELIRSQWHSHVFLRKNENRWPPLHTPIMWQRAIPNRAAVLMHKMKIQPFSPQPPIFSLVTGRYDYNELTVREILAKWIDHPQLLWPAVCETLAAGVQTVVHVGPEPNLLPATFKRLRDNVNQQLASRSWGSIGLRAVSRAVRRPWLAKLLPSQSTLLRAPVVEHVILEDWLLEARPAKD